MAYIGVKPTIGNFQICDAISVVNGQAAYTMQVGSVNVSPQSANHMIVSLNGVIQKPGSSYTVSGNTITFASNLATGDVIDFIQILGDVLDLGVPSDATVTAAKLTANSITGQTAETSIATDDTVLIHDTSAGALRKMTRANFVSGIGGTNSVRFRATMGSNQSMSDNVAAKIQFNTEDYDVGSCFDTSNYRFTVPSGEGGLYLIYSQIQLKSYDDGQHIESFIKLYKNGSATYYSYDNFSGTGNTNGNMLYNTQVINLSASDYIEVYGQCNVYPNSPECKAGYSYFQGFKLIT